MKGQSDSLICWIIWPYFSSVINSYSPYWLLIILFPSNIERMNWWVLLKWWILRNYISAFGWELGIIILIFLSVIYSYGPWPMFKLSLGHIAFGLCIRYSKCHIFSCLLLFLNHACYVLEISYLDSLWKNSPPVFLAHLSQRLIGELIV